MPEDLKNYDQKHSKGQRGFTLAEMSFVLIIAGVLIMTIFPALRTVLLTQRTQETERNLESLTRSIAAFVTAHGCLPCPTPQGSIGERGDGWIRGTEDAEPCGTCSTVEGVVPYLSLGIPRSFAHDGWGHWIRLRVDPELTNSDFAEVVPPSRTCPVDEDDCANGSAIYGLCQEELSTSSAPEVYIMPNMSNPAGTARKMAFVLVSHGADGYGAIQNEAESIPFPDNVKQCKFFGFARCNADDDVTFYDAIHTNNETRPFDDRLVYLSRNALVTYLGGAGCASSWGEEE